MTTSTTSSIAASEAVEKPAPAPAWKGALAGAVAGASALAAGELAAGLVAPRPGPVTAVANRVVDEAPTWFVNFGKDVFGLADKPALILGTVIISLVVAAVLGVASIRHRWIGVLGIVAFGIVGFLAIASDAQAGPAAALFISVVSVTAGVFVLLFLLALAEPAPAATELVAAEPSGDPVHPPVSRRSFLGWAGAVGALAGVSAYAADALRSRASVDEARAAVQLTEAGASGEVADMVAAADAHPVAATPSISPIVVPNDDFYRIDTALLVPNVDPAGWTLTIKGMVDREMTYTYDDLLARATTVAPVTLSCVSNEIGGRLVGNAVWQGIPLTELLDEAGVQPGATQVKSTSVDGWDCGFPTDVVYDGRTALVALFMNDEPLPVRHGFPARLVVSGLYGYVSATKWLDEIELTTLEDFDGYWIPRGWSKEGPIKTQSRIDTPRGGASLTAGEMVPIAGVAWAPNSGIDRVEVQVDDGPWREAELGASLGINSWRQWRLGWEATPGEHRVRVRATDGSGATQTEEVTNPAPNGASGWHTITVSV